MGKFKVGDHVKIVRDVFNEGHPIGFMNIEGGVVEVDEYDERLSHCISIGCCINETWWCSSFDLEFVTDDDDLL